MTQQSPSLVPLKAALIQKNVIRPSPHQPRIEKKFFMHVLMCTLKYWISKSYIHVLVPFMANGRAKTPDPAISPAKKMAAVTTPRPCSLTSFSLWVFSRSAICRPREIKESGTSVWLKQLLPLCLCNHTLRFFSNFLT